MFMLVNHAVEKTGPFSNSKLSVKSTLYYILFECKFIVRDVQFLY